MKNWNKIPIDGSIALVDGFGGEELFIKKTIEDCIFFEPIIVKERFNEVIANLNILDNSSHEDVDSYISNCRDIKILPVRKSEKDRVYYNLKTTIEFKDSSLAKVIKIDVEPKGKKQDCLVYIDKDGNYAVKEIIKSNTCCVVNGSKKSLVNYIISHIWGQAKDPRYFSNLWNIVLVPSYANPLLDKNYEKDSTHPGTKLLNTLKAVMTGFYCFNDLEWDKLKMNQPSYEKNQVISIKEKLKIHYLKRKPYDSGIGSVEQEIMETDFDMVDTEFCDEETRVDNIKEDKNTGKMKTEYEEEIKKVRRRVPGWKRKPDQVNSKILGLFMELSDNGKKGIFIDVLFDEFENKCPEEISLFVRNYNQMKNISEKNHGKVFSEDEEKTVWLWEPVKDFIIETYSY